MARNILIILLAIAFAGCAHYRAEETAATKKVSDLIPLSEAPASTDKLFIDDSGQSKSITADNFLRRLESEITSYEISKKNLPDNYKKVVGLIVFDASETVSVGDGANSLFWAVPALLDGWSLSSVAAYHQTNASTSGTTTIQIRNTTISQDMLSTRITIDYGELGSIDASATYAIHTTYDEVSTGDQIRIDIDAIPSGATPYGLYIELVFEEI